jgi:hypothetical protein
MKKPTCEFKCFHEIFHANKTQLNYITCRWRKVYLHSFAMLLFSFDSITFFMRCWDNLATHEENACSFDGLTMALKGNKS